MVAWREAKAKAPEVNASGLAGIFVCIAIAAGLVMVEEQILWLPGPLVAMAAGILLGRLYPRRLAVGAQIAAIYFLRTGIILLGLRLSLDQLGTVGAEALLVIVPCIVIGVLVAIWLGRAANLGRGLSLLLAVGTAICGNSAIAVVAPSIHADEEEVTAAITSVTVYGTLALFTFPLIGGWLDLSAREIGTWIGTAVNDTSQVVAAAFSVSERVGEVGTIVKLARNLFIIPAAVVAAWIGASHGRDRSFRVGSSIPWFVVGFVAAAAFSSVVVLPGDVLDAASQLSKGLILAALVGIGMRAASLRADRRFFIPLAVGSAAGIVLAIVSFTLVYLIV